MGSSSYIVQYYYTCFLLGSNSNQQDQRVQKDEYYEEIRMDQYSQSKFEEMAMTSCAAYGDINLSKCATYDEIPNNVPNESLGIYETVQCV